VKLHEQARHTFAEAARQEGTVGEHSGQLNAEPITVSYMKKGVT